jgi:peptide/nickel transport system permease protein
MRPDYILKRFAIFLFIIWAAATLNFFIPRMGSRSPIEDKLMTQAATGGYLQQGVAEMVREYESKFGLDKPLWQQYLTYLADTLRFDFNYSISNYPRRVVDILLEGLPWTMGLLTMTTLISFVIGNLLGAFLGWPRSPRWIHFLMPPLLALHALPFFLLGLVLVYIFAFTFQVLPLYGGHTTGAVANLSLEFALDVAKHAILPAASIVLVSIGGWALGMRAMMVTTQGEDYTNFADAKGLAPKTIFFHYAIRNALLPQVTALALVLGQILSGAVLVEVIFGYPGIGTVLFQAIRGSDFFLVQGIVFVVIISIGIATFVLDLIYPLLDPRITYQRG